jgi:hypothetical protein
MKNILMWNGMITLTLTLPDINFISGMDRNLTSTQTLEKIEAFTHLV